MRLSEEIPSVLSIIIKYKCSVSENKTFSVSLFVMSDFMSVLLAILKLLCTGVILHCRKRGAHPSRRRKVQNIRYTTLRFHMIEEYSLKDEVALAVLRLTARRSGRRSLISHYRGGNIHSVLNGGGKHFRFIKVMIFSCSDRNVRNDLFT